MNTVNLLRIFLYIALLSAMLVSSLTLEPLVKTRAEGDSCCSVGQDCKTKASPRCCLPGPMEADCSQGKPNYCRNSSCS